MSELYPLLLKPEFRERIWGARDLSPIYGEAPGTAPIGEVWLTGDHCQVANGPLAGTSLAELCRRFGRELVGETAPEPDRFPLLIKFLFPREKLSVQVHPDDEGARRLGQPCGKTECWYVLRAEPGAQVGLGLKPGATRQQFAQAIREVRAEQLLNWIDIHAGELIYVDAGTVHAIGPGSILVETQQNSDTTFRLYDYGRPRELHVEQGLQALKERTRAGKVRGAAANPRRHPGETNERTFLVISPSFQVEKLRLSAHDRFSAAPFTDRAVRIGRVLVGLDGCGTVEAPGCATLSFGRGDAVVIPAAIPGFEIRGQWDVNLLLAAVPSGNIAEPHTAL
jgi:mannose-6-phosphate isomerase